MKHKKALYLYHCSLPFAAIGLIGFVGVLIYTGGEYSHTIPPVHISDFLPNIIIALIFLFLTCLSLFIRSFSKSDAFVDEYGNSTKSYSSLSGSERRQVDLINIAGNESILSTAEFKSMLFSGSINAQAELNHMIGLNNIKEEVEKLNSLYEYGEQTTLSSKHMCFLGNPGTGKTSVAKIITGILFQYRQIKKNELIYLDAATLLSSSNPVKKTQLILQKSHERVLFIDEAYALAFDRTYGPEILALILNAMENYRNSLVIIFAGYKEEMKYLFAMNSGLQSRFGKYFFFEDYDQFQMMQIFTRMADAKHFRIHPDAAKKLMQLFVWNKCLPSFANGRTVRKIFENTINNHYYNLSTGRIDAETDQLIMAEDIKEHSEEDNYFSSF